MPLPAHIAPDRPTTYTLELTAACNHRCVGCGNVFSPGTRQMPGADWLKLIGGLGDQVAQLRITGGECTLHPEFETIITEIDKTGIRYVIFTNGSWHRPRELVNFFSSCKHLDGLLISLHGCDSGSFQTFVAKDTFEDVKASIRLAAGAGLRVATNTLLLRSTVQTIEEIASLSFSLGAVSAAFSRYYGKSMPELELSPADLHDAMAQIARLQKNDRRITFNNCVPMCFTKDLDLLVKGCTSGLTHCTIDPAGNVRPCTHSPVIAGSLWQNSIGEVWASEQMQAWRSLIPKACLSCGMFQRCRGGCRATAYQLGEQQDSLIRVPFGPVQTVPPILYRQYRYARPVIGCRIDRVGSVVYLISPSQHLAVSPKALPILEMLNGQNTLEQISARFGQVAIDFVGTLMVNGLVELPQEQ